jgi:hypothetical protein
MKRALLVGLNYQDTSNELRGCHNDINNNEKLLIKYEYNKIIKLLDSAQDYIGNTTDTSPTIKNVMTKFMELIDESKQGDTIFFHYSGHGYYKKDTTIKKQKDELDGRDEQIYLCDGFLTDDMFSSMLKKAKSGVKIIGLFDCCHSGTMFDLPYKFLRAGSCTIENRIVYNADIICISGCTDFQTSSDAYLSGQNQGAETWAWLECINKIETSKIKWTWCEVLLYIRDKLKKSSFKQIPQLTITKYATYKANFKI